MKNQYDNRKLVILGIAFISGLIFILRLFYLQVVDNRYALFAESNVMRKVTQYPARGLILDRKGVILVYNEAAYDLMVTPRLVREIDTAQLCEILDMTLEDFVRKLETARSYSPYKASVFEAQISKETYGYLEEKLFKFKGFYVQARTLRKYPAAIAAHTLGYVGEVDPATVESNPYYKSGDYIGISGLERSYEQYLRGVKGSRMVMVDVFNREKGSFQDGRYDTTAVRGSIMTTTLDAVLQQYGEMLMANKKGSIVAIEPSTGEILALVSVPAYNPNLLVGRVRGRNYNYLLGDSLKPLFNRALMAVYSPGSVFKVVNALIALEEGVINPETFFPCDKSLVNCHNHPSPAGVERSIQYSCNPYYYMVYKRIIQQNKASSIYKDSEMGVAAWKEYAAGLGLGHKLGIDVPGEKPGFIPGIDFYNKWYGAGRWAFSTIYSNGIGQGEVQVVPLQMANLAAVIANRGFYYTPHFVKKIEGVKDIDPAFREKHLSGISSQYFDLMVNAMQAVVEEGGGTARRARIEGISVCGKTGTVQNPHGEDHSGFIAFAPRDNPKIAIAVYVENAGFGGTWAAPIASLMIEKYLNDTIADPEKEKRILEFKLQHE